METGQRGMDMILRGLLQLILYRVIYRGVPVAEAKRDMNTVWQPDETWRDLIFRILAQNDISPDCEGCDWTVTEMDH